CEAQLCGLGADAFQRLLQILLDIVVQRLEGGHVQHLHPVGWMLVELIETPQEGRQRFPGACGRQDQGVLPGGDGGPPQRLRRARTAELLLEPAAYGGMEQLQWVGHCWIVGRALPPDQVSSGRGRRTESRSGDNGCMSRMRDRFERMLRGEEPTIAVGRLVGFRLTGLSDGRATFEMEVGPQHHNPMGTLHGGVLCDLADAAMGVAYSTTLGEDQSFTTLELKINFLRPFWTGRLQA